MTLSRIWRGPTNKEFLDDPVPVLADLYDELAEEINAPSWMLSGATAVGAAAVTVNVPIVADRLPLYVTVTPSWLTTFRVTAVTVTGFTVDFGTPPGGAGGTIAWMVIQPEAGPGL